MGLVVALVGRWLAVVGVLLPLLVGGVTAEAGQRTEQRQPRVLATRVDTVITPVVADHLAAGLEKANAERLDAYVIEMDTPGGLVTSMRNIVQDMLNSPVPVIVYVSPDGARAASAGAIIAFASHVALMAPGTSIGAATPVGLQGGDVSTKIINDAAAQAKALAQLRGRNEQFAVDTVRRGRAASVARAVRLGAVDARAPTLAAALAAADGRRVTVASDRQVTVQTAGAVVQRDDLGAFQKVRQFLADPNLAFLLLTVGALGLIYELATPGVGFAGATGATALILAMFSLSVLPVNVVGLLLLAVATGLFVAEPFAPGIAGFAVGGAVVLILAALFLFDDAEGVSVDPSAAIPTAVVAALAAILAGRVTLRTRKTPSTTSGPEMFTGRTVTVHDADGHTGRTFIEGAWWALRTTGPILSTGQRARVIGLDGLVMLVDPTPQEQVPAAPEPEHEEEP